MSVDVMYRVPTVSAQFADWIQGWLGDACVAPTESPVARYVSNDIRALIRQNPTAIRRAAGI